MSLECAECMINEQIDAFVRHLIDSCKGGIEVGNGESVTQRKLEDSGEPVLQFIATGKFKLHSTDAGEYELHRHGCIQTISTYCFTFYGPMLGGGV